MVHTIQTSHIKIIVGFVVIILLSGSLALAQERVEQIDDREYQLVDSQWIYLNSLGNTIRFSPERIIIRFSGNIVDIGQAKQALSITDLEIAGGPLKTGYYLFKSPGE